MPNLAPTSSWRAVGASFGGFLIETLVDELIHAAGADPGQAGSVRAGAAAARCAGADRVLVVLGDTPFTTARPLAAVVARAQDGPPSACWTDAQGDRPGPAFPSPASRR